MKKENLLIALITSIVLSVSCGREKGTDNSQAIMSDSDILPGWTIADVPVSEAVVMDDHYPFEETLFRGGVVGLPNVVYARIPGYRPLTLDMYLPPDRSKSYPMVMYIHGGGWYNGHSRQSGAFEDWPGTLAMIASHGYVVTSVNYRLGSEATFPAPIQDIKTALRWLRAHAADYSIDKEKFLVWGASAGGHLAALAGTSFGIHELEPVDLPDTLAIESDRVQATIGWYGIYDLTGMGGAGGPGGYFGGKQKEASPATYVDASDGPFLLIHGEEDPVINYKQSVSFNDLLLANNVKSTIHIIPGVAHSFIGKSADATREASIKALEISMEFMDEVFKK